MDQTSRENTVYVSRLGAVRAQDAEFNSSYKPRLEGGPPYPLFGCSRQPFEKEVFVEEAEIHEKIHVAYRQSSFRTHFFYDCFIEIDDVAV